MEFFFALFRLRRFLSESADDDGSSYVGNTPIGVGNTPIGVGNTPIG